MDKVIYAFGDSITYGAVGTNGGWVAEVNRAIQVKKLAGFDSDYWAVIYNLGISGDTSTGLLERFDSDLSPRLGGEENEYIFLISIGVNDSLINLNNNTPQVSEEQYASNLEQIFAKANSHSKNIAVVGLTPIIERMLNPLPWGEGSRAYLSEKITKYNQILKTVASSSDVEFIDIEPVYSNQDLTKLLPDGLHPNDQGHLIIAEEVIKYLHNVEAL